MWVAYRFGVVVGFGKQQRSALTMAKRLGVVHAVARVEPDANLDDVAESIAAREWRTDRELHKQILGFALQGMDASGLPLDMPEAAQAARLEAIEHHLRKGEAA